MSRIHAMSLRLPSDLAFDVELVARVDGVSMSALINDAIDAHIRQRRADPEFQRRLQARIDADKELLIPEPSSRCLCGHLFTEHNGNYNGSRACDHCTCPASRI